LLHRLCQTRLSRSYTACTKTLLFVSAYANCLNVLICNWSVATACLVLFLIVRIFLWPPALWPEFPLNNYRVPLQHLFCQRRTMTFLDSHTNRCPSRNGYKSPPKDVLSPINQHALSLAVQSLLSLPKALPLPILFKDVWYPYFGELFICKFTNSLFCALFN
jgi:hypothetical protein